MRKDWLLAVLGVTSLLAVGCGSSGGGGTGGSGGGAGAAAGGHAGGAAGSGAGGHAGATGGAGGAGGATGGAGGAAGGAAGAAGGAGGAAGTAGAAGSAGGTAGSAGAGGKAGGGGGAAGNGAAGAGGKGGGGGGAAGSGAAGAGGKAGGSGTSDAGTDALAICGTDTDPSEGLSCNTVVATGPCVVAALGTGPIPTAAGGTIEVGTYDLVNITIYPGDSGTIQVLSPARKTVTIAHGTAGAFDIQEADAAGTYERRQNGTLTTSSAMITFTQACPSTDAGNASGTVGYTFTPGATATLAVIEPHGGIPSIIELYQKR